MRALIVVESWFGNTREVAEAVADGVGRFMPVEVRTVTEAAGHAPPPVDLLVVGAPTHVRGMSRPNTRREAARQAGVPDAPGVREWLDGLAPGLGAAAAFDTRVDKGWIAGSAARGIAKRLRRLGARVVVDPESFVVADTPGPLGRGELDRATQWGEELGSRLLTRPAEAAG